MEAMAVLQSDMENLARQIHRCGQFDDSQIEELIAQAFSSDVSSGDAAGGSSGRPGAAAGDGPGRGAGGWKSKWLWALLVLSAGVTVALMDQRASTYLLGYTQDLVYPAMRHLRLWTLPLTRAADLARFHEEECIVPNPLYLGEPCGECWPCADVRTVLDMTGLRNFSDYYYHGGVPFIVTSALYRPVTYGALQRLHADYRSMLLDGTAYFTTNEPGVPTMDDFFRSKSVLDRRDLHVFWLPRRVAANRVLRTVIQRPHFIPANSEVSLEKYIYIDGHNSSPYQLPQTEFANVFVIQGSGSRTIALAPVDCCKRECRHVMVRLNAKELLYYNWQFWKPVSVSPDEGLSTIIASNVDPADSVSVTIVGSFY